MTELFQGPLHGEIVKSAITDVGEVEPAGREPSQRQGGAHAGAFGITFCQICKVAVNCRKEFGKDILKVGRAALGPCAKAPGKQPRDFIDDDPAGKLPTLGTAHAIADGEYEIGCCEGSGTYFAKKVHFGGIEGKRQKSILVVRADFPGMGEA